MITVPTQGDESVESIADTFRKVMRDHPDQGLIDMGKLYEDGPNSGAPCSKDSWTQNIDNKIIGAALITAQMHDTTPHVVIEAVLTFLDHIDGIRPTLN